MWAWAFRSPGGAEKHVQVKGSTRVDSYRLGRSLAAEGSGIARIPDVFAAPLVKERALVPVLEKYWQKTELFAGRRHCETEALFLRSGAPHPALRADLSPLRRERFFNG